MRLMVKLGGYTPRGGGSFSRPRETSFPLEYMVMYENRAREEFLSPERNLLVSVGWWTYTSRGRKFLSGERNPGLSIVS
jgi:hypothetical protein